LEPKDARWRQRFENLLKAYALFEEATIADRLSVLEFAIFGSSVTEETASELSRELNERVPIPYASMPVAMGVPCDPDCRKSCA